jgi:hypothetical protein
MVRRGLRSPVPDGRAAPGGVGKLLSDDTRQLMIVLHRHDTNGGTMFGESVTGLDHAGFMVPDRGDFEAWQCHLETNGVVSADIADKPLTQSPIADEPYASSYSATLTTSSWSSSRQPEHQDEQGSHRPH